MYVLNPLFSPYDRDTDGVFHRVRMVPLAWSRRHIADICDEAYWGIYNEFTWEDLALSPPKTIGPSQTEEDEGQIWFTFYTAPGEPMEAIRFVSRVAARFPLLEIWHDYEDTERELLGRLWYRTGSLYKEMHLTPLTGQLRGI